MSECAKGQPNTCDAMKAHLAMEPGQMAERAKLYDRLRATEADIAEIKRTCADIAEIKDAVGRLELAAAKREAAEGVALWVGRGILTLGGAAIVWWLERYFNGK